MNVEIDQTTHIRIQIAILHLLNLAKANDAERTIECMVKYGTRHRVATERRNSDSIGFFTKVYPEMRIPTGMSHGNKDMFQLSMPADCTNAMLDKRSLGHQPHTTNDKTTTKNEGKMVFVRFFLLFRIHSNAIKPPVWGLTDSKTNPNDGGRRNANAGIHSIEPVESRKMNGGEVNARRIEAVLPPRLEINAPNTMMFRNVLIAKESFHPKTLNGKRIGKTHGKFMKYGLLLYGSTKLRETL